MAALIRILLIGLIIYGIVYVVRRRRSPEQRLRRHFRRLRRDILHALEGSTRDEAVRVLDATGDVLEDLIRAHRQRDSIKAMADAVDGLSHSGDAMSAAQRAWAEAYDRSLQEQTEALFVNLTRVTSALALSSRDAMDNLNNFSQQLTSQREALRGLSDQAMADWDTRFAEATVSEPVAEESTSAPRVRREN